MKLFLFLIPFMCLLDPPKKCASKKVTPVKKEAKVAPYQFPSILIISIN